MRDIALHFTEETDLQFEEIEGDDVPREEMRETFRKISDNYEIDNQVKEIIAEGEDPGRIPAERPPGTDPALKALTAAWGIEGLLSSAESRVGFWTRVRARAQRLGVRARQWIEQVHGYVSLIRQSLQATLSWLMQLISSMRTPTGWAIAGSMNVSFLGVGGQAQLELSFGLPPSPSPPSGPNSP